MTKAESIIEFISGLHGMDRLARENIEDQRPGAFDLLTAQSIEAHPEFPEAEYLLVEQSNGNRVSFATHKLLEALLVRTAEAWALTQGGTAKSHYLQLQGHLAHKTGFGL